MTLNENFEPSNDDNNGDWKARLEPSIPKEIDAKKFTELLLAGKIVDGRAGGLVLAKINQDEPTRLIYKLGATYVLNATVDAGSFILNGEAALRNRNRIKKMNAGLTIREMVMEPNGEGVGQFISAAGFPHNRIVWIDLTQDIVNPEPAEKHMYELNVLNTALNPYLNNDLYDVFDLGSGPLTASYDEV